MKTARQALTERTMTDFLRDSLLNSAPQLLARDRCAVAQGAQRGPGDLQMDAAAQAAVGAGDDVFLADDFSERDEAIGYYFSSGCLMSFVFARSRPNKTI
jgi:hypothetical protein